jgi:hypothetical protein
MAIHRFVCLFVLVSFVFSLVPARGQDAGALLDLLVRKKIITDQEAEEVRAELVKESATTAAGKWKLSTPITELEIYGDARVRYEYRGGRTADDVDHPNDWLERKRERYRLRLGLRGTLADDWFFGLRLETSTNPRSTNVTFADDTSTITPGASGNTKTINGPFAKNSDGINVGQAYLGYRGFHDITLTAGRMPQPLITTLMTWDADINPEGLAEQWKHTFTFDFGGGAAVESAPGYSKEGGKEVVATQTAAESFKMKIDVFANFAQFVYDDSNPENPIGPQPEGVPNTDAFLLAWQVGARVNFPHDIYVQFAPTVYNYTGNGDTFNGHFIGGDETLSNSDSLATNQTGINSLLILDVPMEIGWKVGELPVRIFGDFAVNFDADDRATAAGHSDKGDQRYAYQIGLGIGQMKEKGNWQLSAFWQHTEQYSLDPNLVESDLFDSRVNMQGLGVTAGYMLSGAVFVNLTYGYGWRSDDSLGTGGVGDIGVNPLDQYQIFQADLNVKF